MTAQSAAPDRDAESEAIWPSSAVGLESADIETTLAAYCEWLAAGRPGAVSHDQAMAELLAKS